jgi:uncharacterized membrane protein
MKKSLLVMLSLLVSNFAFAAETLYCAGTEPFWGITITDKTIHYRSPEVLDGEVTKVRSRSDAAGMPTDRVVVIKTKHTSVTLVADDSCTDGMSEETYRYHAVYVRKGTVLYGCCK